MVDFMVMMMTTCIPRAYDSDETGLVLAMQWLHPKLDGYTRTTQALA